MILRISMSSSEPIYRQIRNQVVQAVASGELRAGDSLPSVRSLASDLGINMHTVNKAYAVLRDEGYVVMMRRNGAVIAEREAPVSLELQTREREHMATSLRSLVVEHKARGGSKHEFMELVRAQVADVYGVQKEELL